MNNIKFDVEFEKIFNLMIRVEAKTKIEAEEKAQQILLDMSKEERLNRAQEGYFDLVNVEEVKE